MSTKSYINDTFNFCKTVKIYAIQHINVTLVDCTIVFLSDCLFYKVIHAFIKIIFRKYGDKIIYYTGLL